MLASSWKWTARPIVMSRGRTGTRKLREALLMVAKQQPRYGYRRLWALLVRQGWEVDVKRIPPALQSRRDDGAAAEAKEAAADPYR